VHYQATEIAKLEFHHDCIRANVPLACYAVKESKNLFLFEKDGVIEVDRLT
jgi:hypothetical protein